MEHQEAIQHTRDHARDSMERGKLTTWNSIGVNEHWADDLLCLIFRSDFPDSMPTVALFSCAKVPHGVQTRKAVECLICLIESLWEHWESTLIASGNKYCVFSKLTFFVSFDLHSNFLRELQLTLLFHRREKWVSERWSNSFKVLWLLSGRLRT